MGHDRNFERERREPASATTQTDAASEQQRMLIAELNHRVRNMLQVVIGLANQTLRRSADLKEFEAAFMGRMQALARAYELLSREGWRRVSLAELMRSQLSAFAAEGDRCSIEGVEVELTPNAALALGLTLYELATNATKYGALSAPEGRLDVKWWVEDAAEEPALVIRWVESGGPTVTEPTRHGFGSELLRRQLQHELSGDAVMEFREGGLEVTIKAAARDAVIAGSEFRARS